jgi:hypothetical protein
MKFHAILAVVRIERLTAEQEKEWREKFSELNWLLGSISLSVTLPEFGGGELKTEKMHFGYYLQPMHLTVSGREDLPRKLLFVLARRKPPLDFLELSGAGIRVPHAFPKGFTLGSVLRIAHQELAKIPVE